MVLLHSTPNFHLTPRENTEVSVCLGTACYVKGAGDIMDKLKEQLGIDDGNVLKIENFH